MPKKQVQQSKQKGGACGDAETGFPELKYNLWLELNYPTKEEVEGKENYNTHMVYYLVPKQRLETGQEFDGIYVIKGSYKNDDGHITPDDISDDILHSLLQSFKVGNTITFHKENTFKVCSNQSPQNMIQNDFQYVKIVGGNITILSGGSSQKASKKATSEKVMVQGRSRVVYQGIRGGKYIKMNGGFVNLKTLV